MIFALALVAFAQADTSTTAAYSEIQQLAQKVADLEARIDEVETSNVTREPPVRFEGYVDFGFFYASGTGSGVIEDFGHRLAPEFGERWTFLGDLLATSVNSRGEAADLGSLPGVQRFDGIRSRGAPGFILNEVNFTLQVTLNDDFFLTTSVNIVPRTGSDFALGDFIDLDRAELEWVVTKDRKLSVFVGKIEPALGIEYRERKSNQRFGITPSLIARYTTGTQLGVKARAKLFDNMLIIAGTFTNGGAGTEQFHFYDETDSNAGKTGAGRISARLPIDRWFEGVSSALEIGASGEVGSQSRARDSDGIAWAFGFDLRYVGADLSVKAQFLEAEAPGRAEDGVYSLDLKFGGYLEIDYLLTAHLGFMVRGEVRDALVGLDAERAYRTQAWRLTGGVRIVVIPDLILKLEYLHNGEYGVVPDIDNDVLTTSLVLSY